MNKIAFSLFNSTYTHLQIQNVPRVTVFEAQLVDSLKYDITKKMLKLLLHMQANGQSMIDLLFIQ